MPQSGEIAVIFALSESVAEGAGDEGYRGIPGCKADGFGINSSDGADEICADDGRRGA